MIGKRDIVPVSGEVKVKRRNKRLISGSGDGDKVEDCSVQFVSFQTVVCKLLYEEDPESLVVTTN